MKAKHIIAVLAALAISVTLLAGCDINRPTPIYVPTPLAPGMSPDDLSAAERQALINRYDLDPATMMMRVPDEWAAYVVEDGPVLPPPAVMGAGVAADDAEVYPLLRNTIDILGSGRFYLRGRSSMPANDMAPASNNTPIAIASDGQRAVLEQHVNWNEMLASDGSFDFGQSRIQGAIFNGTFGNQMRMILDPAGPIIAFPQRNNFLSFADMIDFFGEEMPTMDLEDFDVMQMGDLEIPDVLNATRITQGGREYLSASIANEEAGVNTFFFHNGQLVRMETVMPDGNRSIIEVDVFHGNPPANLFTTQGMSRMPMAELMRLMEGMGGDGGGLFDGLF
ncbi:MAG: hypothetical protein FWB76_02375 [Oscillospiraceae bacterium]|nr:hypothetical protein [Oscillospiraceae bacterium]